MGWREGSTSLYLEGAHSTILVGDTGSGKTLFVLHLLEGPLKGRFQHRVVVSRSGIQQNITDSAVNLVGSRNLHSRPWAAFARLFARFLRHVPGSGNIERHR